MKVAAGLFALLTAISAMADTPEPVTTEVWREAVVSVSDPDVTARFFREIGGYGEKWRGPPGWQ